jgi:hypothetical protein
MKVLSLPFTGFLIVWILTFGMLEDGWVVAPPAMQVYRWNKLVEHFVENHTFNKIVRYK